MSVFELQFSSSPALPQLAWLAQMEKGRAGVHVTCGAGVEQAGEWFFEGAWGGDFAAADLLSKSTFGTGAQLGPEGITFIPPDHLLDRLYVMRREDQLWISNSLGFLLARTGARADPNISDYYTRFAEMRWGLQNARTELPLAGGETVTLWAWHHLHVTPALEISDRPKARSVPTRDYTAYADGLKAEMAAVFANAADPARRAQYTPLTTLSSGYDSTAISALAADLGCTDALTFPASRGKFGKAASDDSGSVAAEVLGLACRDHDRLGYRAFEDLPEIETLGVGCELSSARDDLAGRVVLTGYMGDSLWDREPATDLTNLRWPIIAGHNMTEMRLKAGFVHVPVPFIGARQQQEIIAISQSAEMAPWTLGTSYDRPICRRMAEERGVPRDAFGQAKKAAAVFFRDEGLAATMAPGSYADYTQFRQQTRPTSPLRMRLADGRVSAAYVLNGVMARGVKALNRLTGARMKPPQVSTLAGPDAEAALLFHWALDRMAERYRS